MGWLIVVMIGETTVPAPLMWNSMWVSCGTTHGVVINGIDEHKTRFSVFYILIFFKVWLKTPRLRTDTG